MSTDEQIEAALSDVGMCASKADADYQKAQRAFERLGDSHTQLQAAIAKHSRLVMEKMVEETT